MHLRNTRATSLDSVDTIQLSECQVSWLEVSEGIIDLINSMLMNVVDV